MAEIKFLFHFCEGLILQTLKVSETFLQVSATPETKTTTWKHAGYAREQLQSPYTKHSCIQESVPSEFCVGMMILHAYMNTDVWICFPQRKSFVTIHPFCASPLKM